MKLTEKFKEKTVNFIRSNPTQRSLASTFFSKGQIHLRKKDEEKNSLSHYCMTCQKPLDLVSPSRTDPTMITEL